LAEKFAFTDMEGLKERNHNIQKAHKKIDRSKTASLQRESDAQSHMAPNASVENIGSQTKPKVGLDEEEMLFLARRCLAEELMNRPAVPMVLADNPVFSYPAQMSPVHMQQAAMLLPQWTIVPQKPVIPERIYQPHHVAINPPIIRPNIPEETHQPVLPQQGVRAVQVVAPVEQVRRNNRLFQLHRLGVGLVILKFGWVWVSCGGLILADSVFCTSDIFVLIYKRIKEHVFHVGSRISASAKETVKLFADNE
jgi:hypothetical protein